MISSDVKAIAKAQSPECAKKEISELAIVFSFDSY
jgi:hypothetical protein